MKRIPELLGWAVFFALAAALLVLRYGLLPRVEQLRPEIVARVTAVIGLPVKIGRIDAEWNGLRPQINLSDVRIYDAAGREALVLPSVENILSWRSLLHGQLRLYALRIDGLRLSVRRDSEGIFYVAGMKISPTGESGFSDWLLRQEEIEIRGAEVEWRDEKRAAPPLVLTAINLRLKTDGEHHAAGLTARLPEAIGTTLQLRAELAGTSLQQLAGWNGRTFVQLGQTELGAWRPWFDHPGAIQSGLGAVRAWGTIESGTLREVTADVELAQVNAKLGEELPPLELAALSGRLQARQSPDGYHLTARKLTFVPQGRPALAPVDFQLAWKADGGVASANTLELAPLAHFAESLPLPPELRKLALELEPRGELGGLRYEWQGAVAAPTQYRVNSRFVDLGIQPREAVPGFAKLAGSLEMSEGGGRLTLQARDVELELPRVFPHPRLTFDTLNGQVDWKRTEGVLNLQLASLTFTNDDLSGNAFGSYAYSGEGPGTLDLSAVLSRADAKNLAHYLPLAAIMGEKPRDWLVKGILGGQASDVQLRLRGDLREFPFNDPARGEFRVTARVQHGLLEYADGWPRIEDIDADLAFEGNRMYIAGRSGRILGASVQDVKVSMPELRSKTPRVQVSGQAQGPTAEFLKFLQSSPLRASAGRFTDGISAVGDGQLSLTLDLPLADLQKTKVAGEYDLAANKVVLHRVLPPLEQAHAKLSFSESSFLVREASGQIFGGEVAITGGTRPGGAVQFVARGEGQPGSLAPLFDHPLSRKVTGSSPYVATVTVRDGLPRIVVDTTLRGVTSALPAPLDKQPADTLPLRVDYSQFEGGARDRIAIWLARVFAADIQRRREGGEMQPRRVGVWLTPTGPAVRLPDRNGVLVYGSLTSLDADRWRALQPSMQGGEALPTTLDVRVGRLDAYGKRFNNLALRSSLDAKGWSAVVDADEIAGQLSYTAEGTGQLVARLLHFTVPATINEAAAGSAKPGEMPGIDFTAERFNLRGKQLGKVEFNAKRDGEDWFIEKLAMTNDDATLNASGRWRGAQPESHLDFNLDAADVGRFLGRVGYPNMVQGAKAELSGSVGWHGELLTMDYATLSGELRLNAEDGQFLEIDPGIGKLISLMNLQALPRRVTLDFRDVFSKGFRFDRIDAVSRVEQGTMQLKDFRMSGPAADVAMSGKVDLAHETQDLKLRVVPSLGGTASTAVAIVNPVAGVAAALAQKVLKNPLGQIFAHQFEVTGSWVDPKVVKLTVEPMPTQIVTP